MRRGRSAARRPIYLNAGLMLVISKLLAMPACAAGTIALSAPHILVRQLVAEQIKVIHGDRAAFDRLQENYVAVSKALHEANSAVWVDNPKNARAIIKFVLSGGPPTVLKELVATKEIAESYLPLATATLAFAEGHKSEAYNLLKKVDHRKLGASLGGQVALVKALIGGASRSEEAYAMLDDACLLSPGTIVEEAALRRHAPVAASDGRLDRFEKLVLRYFRRFPNSLYSDGMLSEVALTLAKHDYGTSPARVRTFERMVSQLPANKRHVLLSAVIQESLALGHMETARFALETKQGLPSGGMANSAAQKVYEAATLILTDDFDIGAAALTEIDKTRLKRAERELAEAATRLVASIEKEAEVSDAEEGQHTGEAASRGPYALQDDGAESGTGADALIAGRRIVDAIDRLLAELDS